MMANNTPRHGWPRGRPPLLHIVHGEHMTEAEACARLGVNRNTLNSWRNRNRRPDGRRPTLEAAWDFYKGWRKGRRRGRRTVWHTLADGTRITQAGAAASVGVSYNTLRSYMWKRGCGLDAAMAYYRARDTEAAVREIMRIIGER